MNLSFTFPILETSATALCGTTGILPIDVGWLKKKNQEKAAQERWEEKFSLCFLAGIWTRSLFSQFTFSHFTPPFILESPSGAFFDECVELGERFMFNDYGHT